MPWSYHTYRLLVAQKHTPSTLHVLMWHALIFFALKKAYEYREGKGQGKMSKENEGCILFLLASTLDIEKQKTY
jgi:hypothetical protein